MSTKKVLSDIPNGGFPPVIICKKDNTKKITPAEFSKLPSAVNIKDILEKRKSVPFFENK